MKPCFKREVCAVIVNKEGQIAVGQNLIYNNDVMECPRIRPEGYEKCISICKQKGHAETEAIRNALNRKMDIEGANLFLMGHHRICDNCKKECDKHNINVIFTEKK